MNSSLVSRAITTRATIPLLLIAAIRSMRKGLLEPRKLPGKLKPAVLSTPMLGKSVATHLVRTKASTRKKGKRGYTYISLNTDIVTGTVESAETFRRWEAEGLTNTPLRQGALLPDSPLSRERLSILP